MQRYCFQWLLKQKGSLTGSKSIDNIWCIIRTKMGLLCLYDWHCLFFPLEQNTALMKCVATSGTGLARTPMVMDRLIPPSRTATKQMDLLIPPGRMVTTQIGQLAHPGGTGTVGMGQLTHPSGTATMPMDHLTPGRMTMAACNEPSQSGLWAPCTFCMSRTHYPRLMWINGLAGHTV